MKRVIILTPGNVFTRSFRNSMTQKENSRFTGYLNSEFIIYGIVNGSVPQSWFATYNSSSAEMLIAACGWVADDPITRDDITMISDLSGKKTVYGLANRVFETSLFKALGFYPHESTYEFETKAFSLIPHCPEIQLLDRTEVNTQIRLQIEELLYDEGISSDNFFKCINDVRFRTAAYIVNGEVRGITQLQIDSRNNPYVRLLITSDKYKRRGIATLLFCYIGTYLSISHPKFYISVPEDHMSVVNLIGRRLCEEYKLGKLIARTVTSEMEVDNLNWYKKRQRGNNSLDEEEFDAEELVE